MADSRRVIKSVSIGVEDSTVDDLSEVAALIGAPSDARIATTGGPLYIPGTNDYDEGYPYSVTFTWVETI